MGVEEEFVLVDPATGAVALEAPRVLKSLGEDPGVMAEFMRFQVETATDVRTRLDEVRSDLVRLRRLVADAAGGVGCLVVASGMPPCGDLPGLRAVTPDPRYLVLAERFPSLVADAGTCACHVHVGIPSRELGAQVLAGLRPWLATLLAISANSPFVHGRDSGWASRRYVLWSRWPTARPPEAWPGAAAYDASIEDMVRSGSAMDARGAYFYARLSPRHPTVEVRVADVCLDVGDAVLLAGLVRGLVVTGLDQARRGARPRPVRSSLVKASLSIAARNGLSGPGIDVFSGGAASPARLVDALLERIRPALRAHGDLDEVERGLEAVLDRGTGATVQRALHADAASPAEFVARLAAVSLGESRAGR